MKFFVKVLIYVSILTGLTGCMNNNEKAEIKEKSEKAAADYIKEEKNRVFVVEESKFTTAVGGGTIFVYGYYKDTKEKISVTVEYGNEYKVGSIAKYK